MVQIPKLQCFNCKRVIMRKDFKGKVGLRASMPKVCPSCAKPIASRASKRKVTRSK